MEKKITFPADTNRLDPYDFKEYKDTVTAVDLSQCTSLEEIPDSMFEDCEQLETVSLPQGLKRIGERAFKYCSKLISIDIPSSVEKLGEGAFASSGLKGIDLSDCEQITAIPDLMLTNCEYLENAVLPNRLKYIGAGAFAGCPKLTELNIPDSVEVFEGGGFLNCSGVKILKMPASLRSIDYIDGFELLDMSQCNSIESFPKISNVSTVYLPSEIEEIPGDKLSKVDYCHAPDTLKKVGAMYMVGLFCNSPKLYFEPGSQKCIVHTTAANESTYKKMADRVNLNDTDIDTVWMPYLYFYLK